MNENASGSRAPPVGAPAENNVPPRNDGDIEYVPNDQLTREPWYHGRISRKEAESLVQRDGDFLVRESQNTPGQYVLTGMKNNVRKHLLLVDPDGIVSFFSIFFAHCYLNY